MDKNSSDKREILSDSEVQKRAAPGGRLVLLRSSDPRGDSQYRQIGSGSQAAADGQALHEFKRARPDIEARRQREGK
jgi:hypothetical protein